MRPIKVIYHYSGDKVDTGSPRALLQMIDSLDRVRFQPAFIGPGAGPLIDELHKRDIETIDSEVTSASWRVPIKTIARLREKRLLLEKLGADIVHVNEPGWNSDIVLAAGSAGIPVALHLHNPQTVFRRNLNFAIARRVFLCSEGQIREIVNFRRIKDKAIILHNAVDIEFFANGRPIRENLGLTKDAIVIGTVAQISHRKGIDVFLDAGQRLLDKGHVLKFVIVGPKAAREEEYFDSIMNRAGQGGLKDNVIYLGSRADIPDIMASLDLFCLPTRAEPFGMVVIEAMAAGVPVVASEVGGIPEIITSVEIGRTVSPITPEAFASAIEELLRMGAARKELGERGRQSLNGRFDLRHMGDVLGGVYEEMTHQ